MKYSKDTWKLPEWDVAFLSKNKAKVRGFPQLFRVGVWSWQCPQPLPPFLSVSQLPAGLFWEFLLTHSQQNIEITGAHGGKWE